MQASPRASPQSPGLQSSVLLNQVHPAVAPFAALKHLSRMAADASVGWACVCPCLCDCCDGHGMAEDVVIVSTSMAAYRGTRSMAKWSALLPAEFARTLQMVHKA